MNTETITIRSIKPGTKYTWIYGGKQVTSAVFHGDYLVIATAEQVRAESLRPGDVIRYEPSGTNFGWFVGKDDKVVELLAEERGR